MTTNSTEIYLGTAAYDANTIPELQGTDLIGNDFNAIQYKINVDLPLRYLANVLTGNVFIPMSETEIQDFLLNPTDRINDVRTLQGVDGATFKLDELPFDLGLQSALLSTGPNGLFDQTIGGDNVTVDVGAGVNAEIGVDTTAGNIKVASGLPKSIGKQMNLVYSDDLFRTIIHENNFAKLFKFSCRAGHIDDDGNLKNLASLVTSNVSNAGHTLTVQDMENNVVQGAKGISERDLGHDIMLALFKTFPPSSDTLYNPDTGKGIWKRQQATGEGDLEDGLVLNLEGMEDMSIVTPFVLKTSLSLKDSNDAVTLSTKSSPLGSSNFDVSGSDTSKRVLLLYNITWRSDLTEVDQSAIDLFVVDDPYRNAIVQFSSSAMSVDNDQATWVTICDSNGNPLKTDDTGNLPVTKDSNGENVMYDSNRKAFKPVVPYRIRALAADNPIYNGTDKPTDVSTNLELAYDLVFSFTEPLGETEVEVSPALSFISEIVRKGGTSQAAKIAKDAGIIGDDEVDDFNVTKLLRIAQEVKKEPEVNQTRTNSIRKLSGGLLLVHDAYKFMNDNATDKKNFIDSMVDEIKSLPPTSENLTINKTIEKVVSDNLPADTEDDVKNYVAQSTVGAFREVFDASDLEKSKENQQKNRSTDNNFGLLKRLEADKASLNADATIDAETFFSGAHFADSNVSFLYETQNMFHSAEDTPGDVGFLEVFVDIPVSSELIRGDGDNQAIGYFSQDVNNFTGETALTTGKNDNDPYLGVTDSYTNFNTFHSTYRFLGGTSTHRESPVLVLAASKILEERFNTPNIIPQLVASRVTGEHTAGEGIGGLLGGHTKPVARYMFMVKLAQPAKRKKGTYNLEYQTGPSYTGISSYLNGIKFWWRPTALHAHTQKVNFKMFQDVKFKYSSLTNYDPVLGNNTINGTIPRAFMSTDADFTITDSNGDITTVQKSMDNLVTKGWEDKYTPSLESTVLGFRYDNLNLDHNDHLYLQGSMDVTVYSESADVNPWESASFDGTIYADYWLANREPIVFWKDGNDDPTTIAVANNPGSAIYVSLKTDHKVAFTSDYENEMMNASLVASSSVDYKEKTYAADRNQYMKYMIDKWANSKGYGVTEVKQVAITDTEQVQLVLKMELLSGEGSLQVNDELHIVMSNAYDALGNYRYVAYKYVVSEVGPNKPQVLSDIETALAAINPVFVPYNDASRQFAIKVKGQWIKTTDINTINDEKVLKYMPREKPSFVLCAIIDGKTHDIVDLVGNVYVANALEQQNTKFNHEFSPFDYNYSYYSGSATVGVKGIPDGTQLTSRVVCSTYPGSYIDIIDNDNNVLSTEQFYNKRGFAEKKLPYIPLPTLYPHDVYVVTQLASYGDARSYVSNEPRLWYDGSVNGNTVLRSSGSANDPLKTSSWTLVDSNTVLTTRDWSLYKATVLSTSETAPEIPTLKNIGYFNGSSSLWIEKDGISSIFPVNKKFAVKDNTDTWHYPVYYMREAAKLSLVLSDDAADLDAADSMVEEFTIMDQTLYKITSTYTTNSNQPDANEYELHDWSSFDLISNATDSRAIQFSFVRTSPGTRSRINRFVNEPVDDEGEVVIKTNYFTVESYSVVYDYARYGLYTSSHRSSPSAITSYEWGWDDETKLELVKVNDDDTEEVVLDFTLYYPHFDRTVEVLNFADRSIIPEGNYYLRSTEGNGEYQGTEPMILASVKLHEVVDLVGPEGGILPVIPVEGIANEARSPVFTINYKQETDFDKVHVEDVSDEDKIATITITSENNFTNGETITINGDVVLELPEGHNTVTKNMWIPYSGITTIGSTISGFATVEIINVNNIKLVTDLVVPPNQTVTIQDTLYRHTPLNTVTYQMGVSEDTDLSLSNFYTNVMQFYNGNATADAPKVIGGKFAEPSSASVSGFKTLIVILSGGDTSALTVEGVRAGINVTFATPVVTQKYMHLYQDGSDGYVVGRSTSWWYIQAAAVTKMLDQFYGITYVSATAETDVNNIYYSNVIMNVTNTAYKVPANGDVVSNLTFTESSRTKLGNPVATGIDILDLDNENTTIFANSTYYGDPLDFRISEIGDVPP